MDERVEEGTRKRAMDEAKSYFDLASSYIRKRPVLIVMCGLIGSGKSYVAKELSKRLFIEVISSDLVRKQLAGIPPYEHIYEEPDKGIYSQEFTMKTYATLFNEAKKRLNVGRSVLLDASFRLRMDREEIKSLAQKTGTDLFLVECRCPDEEIKRRLSRRMDEGVVSNGRLEIYEHTKQSFEEVLEIPENSHIIIHTDRPSDEVISKLIDKIAI